MLPLTTRSDRTVPRRTIVVIGGGFAGTAVAVRLLRSASDLDVALVDASGTFGPGVAYATRDPLHLLNVPAGRLSIDPDVAGGFVDWARARGLEAGPDDFLPRGTFGDYVRDALDVAELVGRARGCVLRRVTALATDVVAGELRDLVRLEGEPDQLADAVVLALGPPAPVPLEALPAHPAVFDDPWQAGALDPLTSPGAQVLLVGSGLTAIDAAMRLATDDASLRIRAVSRKGAMPFAHAPAPLTAVAPPDWPPGPLTLDALVDRVHTHVANVERDGGDWRAAVDSLRPQVQGLWGRLDLEDQRRFLREHSRAWEVRRHRMAPQVAARIAELLATGRLELVRSSIDAASVDGPHVHVRLADDRTFAVDRVIRCTGPSTLLARDGQPLVRRLLETRRAQLDPLGLGLRAAADGRLLGEAGEPDARMWLIGALRRGELWETTAVAELREQATRVAARLLESMHDHA